MVKRRVTLSFPEELLKEPVIHIMGHQFKIVVNIRQGEISDTIGWVSVEMEGDGEEIDNAIAWAISKGVRVEQI